MNRCVVMFNNTDDVNVSILSDNKLIMNCVGNYNLDKFLHNTNIDELSVIFKPTVVNSVPENGYRVGTIRQEVTTKVCVISNEDINNLVDLSKVYKIPNVSIYNYMDIICDKFKDKGKAIIVADWSSNLVALFYLESGVILDFKKTNTQKLTATLSRFRTKYKCMVLEDMGNYDYLLLHNTISNISTVSSENKAYISHLNYIMSNQGFNLLDARKPSPNVDDILVDFEKESEVSPPNDVVEDNRRDSKGSSSKGFFGKIFGRNKSDSTFDFASYDEDYNASLMRENQRYMKQGYTDDIQYLVTGRDAISVHKSGPFDFIFYAIVTILISCILFSAVLGTVYKGRVGLLSSNVDTIQSLNSDRQRNIELSKNSPSSPASKVSTLISFKPNEESTVSSVAYTGESYQVAVDVNSDADLTNEIKDSVPEGFVVSSIKKNVSSTIANGFSYALTLSTP